MYDFRWGNDRWSLLPSWKNSPPESASPPAPTFVPNLRAVADAWWVWDAPRDPKQCGGAGGQCMIMWMMMMMMIVMILVIARTLKLLRWNWQTRFSTFGVGISNRGIQPCSQFPWATSALAEGHGFYWAFHGGSQWLVYNGKSYYPLVI